MTARLHMLAIAMMAVLGVLAPQSLWHAGTERGTGISERRDASETRERPVMRSVARNTNEGFDRLEKRLSALA